jgi:hypothetical protein
MGLLTNRNAARSAARAKFKIDVQNACPPTASTLPLIGRTTAGPAGSSPTKTTPIDGARERGTTTAIGPSCRLARCTKVVRYLRYCRRAGLTAVIAVLDPRPDLALRSRTGAKFEVRTSGEVGLSAILLGFLAAGRRFGSGRSWFVKSLSLKSLPDRDLNR